LRKGYKMYTLTNEEVELLLKNPDPKVAAAALKLKESEEKGEFIPKSRLNDVSKTKKELEDELKVIKDGQKKAEEEKAKADGKLGELLKAREDEVVKLKLDFETAKADADAYHKYQTSVIEEAKKVMGEKWDDNFAKLPLDTVVKLAGVSMKSPGMGGTPPPSQNINNLYTMDEIKGMTQEEVNTNLEKVNKSLAAMKK
jgi:hypothetical protein